MNLSSLSILVLSILDLLDFKPTKSENLSKILKTSVADFSLFREKVVSST